MGGRGKQSRDEFRVSERGKASMKDKDALREDGENSSLATAFR